MRNFIIVKNGKTINMIHESGNLQALCTELKIEGLPEFPTHVHEDLLFANVDGDIYMVFDCVDGPMHNIALSVIREAKGIVVKKPHVLKLPTLFKLPKITVSKLGEPSYVV